MLGAIIGDIVGSIYEFSNIKTKDFPLFQKDMSFTDDSILSIATADWLLNGGTPAECYAHYAHDYPHPKGSYGTSFSAWARRAQATGDLSPYNSCGNGSAMRVSPVGWASDTATDVCRKARQSAECTHNHPEGIKGAEATALCILMARQRADKRNIGDTIRRRFGYDLSMTVAELQRRYSWNGIDGQGNGALCQESVPQAIICALEATDFEDAIRNAISIGGDSDTIGCIAGSIAEPLYGIPAHIRQRGMDYLPGRLEAIVRAFEEKFGAA